MTNEVANKRRLRSTQSWLAADWQSGFGVRTLTALFMVEVAVLAVAQLPLSLSWSNFAFMDQGANLVVQKLLDRGLVPTVDFGYIYGLLPLLFGRLWFGLLGLTPFAYAAAMLVADLLIAWGLARCLSAMKAGPAGIALVVVAMPWAALASYINFAHAIEAVLIIHALAEHASGRKPRALALLTVCLFVKPVMAYVYGFLLVLLIVRDAKGSARDVLRALVPSAAIAVVLLLVCGGWFGVKPLVNSLLPVAGAATYRAMGYGFFHWAGRRFWLPDHVRPAFYLLTPAGHYLLGTLVLIGAAVAALVRQARRSSANIYRDEVIACCAIMQVAFLAVFYGDFMSWTYYYYILIVGLAGLAALSGRSAILVALIAVAALVGDKYQFSWTKTLWATTRPTADMARLWTSEGDRDEWHKVLKIIGDRRATVISTAGEGLTVIVPGFAPAKVLYLVPKSSMAAEVNRKLDQVASTEFVLVHNDTPDRSFLSFWPQFREVLDPRELVYSSEQYQLYRRGRAAGSPPGKAGDVR